MSQLFPIIKVDGRHLTTSNTPIPSSTLNTLVNTLSPSLSLVGLLTTRHTTPQQLTKIKNTLTVKESFVELDSQANRSRLNIQPPSNFTIIRLQCSIDLCLHHEESQNISKVIQRSIDQNKQIAILQVNKTMYKADSTNKLSEFVNNGIIQGHLIIPPLYNRQYLNRSKTLRYVGNIDIGLLVHKENVEVSYVVDAANKQLSKVLKTLAKNNLTYRTVNIKNGILIEQNYSDKKDQKVEKTVEQPKVAQEVKSKQPLILMVCFIVFIMAYLGLKFI